MGGGAGNAHRKKRPDLFFANFCSVLVFRTLALLVARGTHAFLLHIALYNQDGRYGCSRCAADDRESFTRNRVTAACSGNGPTLLFLLVCGFLAFLSCRGLLPVAYGDVSLPRGDNYGILVVRRLRISTAFSLPELWSDHPLVRPSPQKSQSPTSP